MAKTKSDVVWHQGRLVKKVDLNRSVASMVKQESWSTFNKRIKKLNDEIKKVSHVNLPFKVLAEIDKEAKADNARIRAYYKQPKVAKAYEAAAKKAAERSARPERSRRLHDPNAVKYKPGKSCPKLGKEHKFAAVASGKYLRCSVCGSTKALQQREIRREAARHGGQRTRVEKI